MSVAVDQEIASLTARMDRVEATNEKTLAIVQGHTGRFDRLEERMDRLEYMMQLVLVHLGIEVKAGSSG